MILQQVCGKVGRRQLLQREDNCFVVFSFFCIMCYSILSIQWINNSNQDIKKIGAYKSNYRNYRGIEILIIYFCFNVNKSFVS